YSPYFTHYRESSNSGVTICTARSGAGPYQYFIAAGKIAGLRTGKYPLGDLSLPDGKPIHHRANIFIGAAHAIVGPGRRIGKMINGIIKLVLRTGKHRLPGFTVI